mmetsp:Transcript_56781/g.139346  ORF Transcript_56781/g.139346 Transcript_56781/m.139346 type:complete len:618 (-) Transcript_56781:25-1878(-)|eukprot:CAMPEP_0206237642 /NCGR_PEP_ID=MMETSP0047_2-20121206/14377_1 /ASSEMBLY_ACC=CAM_ASM_000192 /TAXON_ID=195065 /ORGANISM="Chroomonas mesostigmatica_cf, Strain CCMP1168" /LENGTH=617 /DNA_ID=CAMNT_0053662097 /DNA_START=242 /DNA_END=2095 /DNA_ORIENTATION=+
MSGAAGQGAARNELSIGQQESAEMEYLIKNVAVGPDRNATINKGGLSTRAVHGGERQKGGIKARATLDALATPIVQTATFTFRNTAELVAYNEGTYPSYEYGRYGNPTVRAAEEKMMSLEGSEDCVISGSGMNSVTTMLLALVDTNGHVVTTTDCYRRTRQFVTTTLPKMGVSLTVIDPADTNELENILKTKGATLFFSEQITNPLTRIIDTPKIVELCRKYGVISCIDTTFATPVNHKPIEIGADIVLHSGTKYLAGHNDVMCGVLCGSKHYIDKIRKLQGVLGGVVDPHAAWLLSRGLKTLSLRVQQQNKTADAMAKALMKHPMVEKVHYPSCPDHRDYAVANRPGMFPCGFGGVISFEVKGNGNQWSQETFDAAARFVDNLHIPYIGPSLGGVESLVEQVRVVGYYDQPLDVRQRLSITNGLIRFACGIEDTQDVIDDVIQALEYVEVPGEVVAPKAQVKNKAWEQFMQKTVLEMPDLVKPITVLATTSCSDAVRVMKKEGIDQMPIVQPFEGEEEVVAVISLAALSKHLLHDPEMIAGPVMQFASQKYVVAEPTSTIASVIDAVNAYTDRGLDSGVVIIAEDKGGHKVLRYIISRIDLLAYETETFKKTQSTA